MTIHGLGRFPPAHRWNFLSQRSVFHSLLEKSTSFDFVVSPLKLKKPGYESATTAVTLKHTKYQAWLVQA